MLRSHWQHLSHPILLAIGRRVPGAAAAALVVALVAAGVAAQDRVGRVAALAQAEREFAAMSVAKGIAPSFHENFAADGIGFWPHPVKVKAETANRPAPPADKPRAVLNWYPVLSDLAASGELGFNLGPSTTTPPATPRSRLVLVLRAPARRPSSRATTRTSGGAMPGANGASSSR